MNCSSWGAYSCEAAFLFLPLFLREFSSQSKENKIPKPSHKCLPSLPHTVKRAATPPPPPRLPPFPKAAIVLPLCLRRGYSPRGVVVVVVVKWSRATALCGAHSSLSLRRSFPSRRTILFRLPTHPGILVLLHLITESSRPKDFNSLKALRYSGQLLPGDWLRTRWRQTGSVCVFVCMCVCLRGWVV